MVDNPNFRSNPPLGHRSSGPATQSNREGTPHRNDPLAELARLIGQTDPFSELNKGSTPRPAASARPAPAPISPQRRASEPYGGPLQSGGHPSDNRGHAAPRHENFQPVYDPAIYGAQAQGQGGHGSEGYYDERDHLHDHAHQPHDEAYEDDYEERPRRRWVKVAAALVVILILGTGGVFAYRTLFSGSSGMPPVIKANTAPSKVTPAPASEASNKQIYDRVGEGSPQGERVVSREEKPVEVKDNSRPPARVAYPGMPGSSGLQAGGGMAEASPPVNAEPVGPGPAEPKRVKTVTIPRDGTGTASAPRQNTPPAARATAPVAPVATAPAVPGNVPLSLNPQIAAAEPSARQALPPARNAPQADPTRLAALPPATEIPAGSYTVQISSQRSEAEAQATFRSLAAKYPSILGDRQPIIRRADLGDRGIFFRALVGPFGSAEQATQFCGSLKSAGGQCVVQRN
jgi:hypothetical protein